jgi:23S rRNA pseudouridine2605 synthase
MSPLVRINKLLSQMGIASRRKADELIKNGAVSVNGEVLKVLGVIIDTEKDKVAVKGEEISLSQPRNLHYYLLNKPKGYISTVKDEAGRKTVLELLPRQKGLFPVGRLDKDTTGLILITDDGELAHRLMHPRYGVDKVYEAEIEGKLTKADIASLEKGVDIGEERPSVSDVVKVKECGGRTRMTLKIHEGRKRQIRRTFEKLGYKLIVLKRIGYAGLKIDIKEGAFRELKEKEVAGLKKKAGLI